MVGPNVREEQFEIVANARQVGFNRLGVNMGTLEGDVVNQGLRCWVNGVRDIRSKYILLPN